MKLKMKAFIMFFFSALLLTSCVSSNSANVYSRDTAMKAQTLEKGTVESVKQVLIEGTNTPVGATIGGISGGVIGSTIGDGSGQKIATVIGALAGLAAGSAAEKGITQKKGLEILVKKDNGQSIVVVQEADSIITPGDRVNIISSNDGTTRVSKI